MRIELLKGKRRLPGLVSSMASLSPFITCLLKPKALERQFIIHRVSIETAASCCSISLSPFFVFARVVSQIIASKLEFAELRLNN